MTQTSNKPWALVTGASSGLGKDFSFELAKRGYNLVLVARREDLLHKLKDELKTQHDVDALVYGADLVKEGVVSSLHKFLQEQDVSISVLINNAGRGLYGPFETASSQEVSSMIRLNIEALTALTYEFLPDLQKANGGHILMVSSVAAYQPCPQFAAYAATKAYVSFLGEALAEEFKSKDVHVTTLCPGFTRTEFFDVMGHEPSSSARFLEMTSKQVAAFGIKALFKNKRVAIPGLFNRLNVIIVKFAPRFLVLKIIGFAMRSQFRKQ